MAWLEVAPPVEKLRTVTAIPTDAVFTQSGGTSKRAATDYVDFQLDWIPVHYSSERPGGYDVVRAVRDRLPLTCRVVKHRTVFGAERWELFEITEGDRRLLTLDEAYTYFEREKLPMYIGGAFFTLSGLWLFWLCYGWRKIGVER